jgi:sugar phosphate permease
MKLGLAYSLVKLVRYIVMLWLPFYLQQVLSFTTTTAAIVSLAFDLGGGVGSPLCGLLADKMFGTSLTIGFPTSGVSLLITSQLQLRALSPTVCMRVCIQGVDVWKWQAPWLLHVAWCCLCMPV